MKKPPSPAATIVAAAIIITFTLHLLPRNHALGGSSSFTMAVIYGASSTVCGIVAGQPTQRIACYFNGQTLLLEPNASFSSISGGRNFFCGIRSGGYSLLCWTNLFPYSGFDIKRLYFDNTVLLENLSIGDDQICATTVGAGNLYCWRGDDRGKFDLPSGQFLSISSGFGFSCGILKNNGSVRCWGSNKLIANQIEDEFRNISMLGIEAGGSHVCGLNSTGFLICKGNNDSGQLNVPSNLLTMEFSEFSLGSNHTCAIRQNNGSVICWGGKGLFSVNSTRGISFETIVSGTDFTCGLTTRNFSVMCWGPGWLNGSDISSVLQLPGIIPGPCIQSSCSECGLYSGSLSLCDDSQVICKRCLTQIPSRAPPPLLPVFLKPSSPSRGLTWGLIAFAIVGSVGMFAGICTLIYCLWTGVCFGHKKKVHNTVQPTITRGPSSSSGTSNTRSSGPPSRTMTIRRQGSRLIRRQRSGPSSKHDEKAEEFSFSELSIATNSFSLENKIGSGSFGIVYKGKLCDGREVAIKRGETGIKTKKFQEKETAFDSEVAILSRLNHKHIVRLVGYCEEKEERLLVYEYMKNGALYDHLHDKRNVQESSSIINSWKMRINIALDATRGIEYLHRYADPPIIHRDIKSSNILLDSNWTARVSDLGLSMMSPQSDGDYRLTKAAGTVGYIDPEYYGLNLLTSKSDVYGLGVVLLELLTGKRAIFKNGESGETPVSVVDFAVPEIVAGKLSNVLDRRVGPPRMNESDAVEQVAYITLQCVNLEGKERPTITDVIACLERALALCAESHGSISTGRNAVVSE